MNTRSRRRGDLLADSEATLRQVRAVVRELDGGTSGTPVGPGRLLEILLEAYAELAAVVERLRRSRSSLDPETLARLQHAHDKLAEVSSTTDVAATDLLDRIDQALELLARLDGLDAAEGGEGTPADVPEERAALRTGIRDRLDEAVVLLRFRDVASRELGHASRLLIDIQDRLAAVADLLSGDAASPAAGPPEETGTP